MRLTARVMGVGEKMSSNVKRVRKLYFRKHGKGFTLIELLVVLLIIGLLAGLAGPALYQRIKPARHSTAKAQIQNFVTALENYAIDVGRYPTKQEGLQALRVQPSGASGWMGPYINKEIPTDPWDNPFEYRVPGKNGDYEILSFGADKKEGGDGDARDVVSWESD
jgi:general secretion pathway protein G